MVRTRHAHHCTRPAVTHATTTTHNTHAHILPAGRHDIADALQAHGPEPSKTSYPDFKFCPSWVDKQVKEHGWSLQQPQAVDPANTPSKREAAIKAFLMDVYSFRDYHRRHACGGDVNLEGWRILDRMLCFDELPERMGTPLEKLEPSYAPSGEPPGRDVEESKYARTFLTVAFVSTPGDKRYPPFMCFDGAHQEQQIISKVPIHGQEYPVFVAHSTSHYNNRFFYGEYLRTCVLNNLPPHTCCQDPECKSVLLLDDSCTIHTTTYVEDTVRKATHVKHLHLPESETSNLCPNVRMHARCPPHTHASH